MRVEVVRPARHPGHQQHRLRPGRPGGHRRTPTVVALVREDGWLVVVDLETGEERELHFGGDPEAPPSGQEEGGPQFIDAVDLSPDGQWVYFSTCCEPASGHDLPHPGRRRGAASRSPRAPTRGSAPTAAPWPPPRRRRDRDPRSTAARDPFRRIVECCPQRLAWSPDGRQLAAVRSTGAAGDVPQVVLFDWDGTSLTPADPGKPDNPGRFVAWTPDGDADHHQRRRLGRLDRSLSQDASYERLLWVDGEGVVREQAGLSSGELPAIAGVPEALAADW